ncbi:MAG: FAD:protein FMN transferase [Lamprobacter sp.]|uniref:FAD:protein FMN transferase n=1 Tax=Lamprobacter sp. TaxID=3100796 RepID=UPI002B262609|nr:FAD:protein FMN transferase [Lamprobacter sp.]MEA3642333.1 FAD:protein FMN transferase [Lamprobacter sp.]
MILKLDDGDAPWPADAPSRFFAPLHGLQRWIASASVVLVSLVLMLVGCGQDSEQRLLVLRGATMGTTYSLQVVDPPGAFDRSALAEQVRARLSAINDLMSTYQPSSELSRFNASSTTDWFLVSPELVAVVSAGQAVSEASNGAFDITVGPLVNLWGFGPTPSAEDLPTAGEIQAARARVGWRQLEVRTQPPALRKSRPDLYVDLSAIAKGYAVDQLAALVESQGVSDYLVEIGGELHGRGVNGRGEPWQIAIERPNASQREVFQVVALRDIGMATSGDYRNFVEIDGQRYSHTIDPATGQPVRHRLASVTVLADDCMQADAWATALLVLGPEPGLALAEQRGLAALFIEHALETPEGDAFVTQETAAFAALSAAR